MIQICEVPAKEDLGCYSCGNLASFEICSEHQTDEGHYQTTRIALCDRCRHILSYDLMNVKPKSNQA